MAVSPKDIKESKNLSEEAYVLTLEKHIDRQLLGGSFKVNIGNWNSEYIRNRLVEIYLAVGWPSVQIIDEGNYTCMVFPEAV